MSERAGNAGGQEEMGNFLLTSLAQYLPAGGLCVTLPLRLRLLIPCAWLGLPQTWADTGWQEKASMKLQGYFNRLLD